jgi:chromosome condensin MukBEF ATPase and DNA-binding subunit MukB
MEYTNEQQFMAQFIKPEFFTERVKTLQQQLPPILDDFNNYFVLYNKTPNYPEYENMFNNIKQNLNNLGGTLFMVSNDVDANIDNINKTFKALDVLINRERKRNRELKRKLGIVETEANSSKEMIHDYNQMYDEDYVRNWGLFLSTVLVGVSISKLFTFSQ